MSQDTRKDKRAKVVSLNVRYMWLAAKGAPVTWGNVNGVRGGFKLKINVSGYVDMFLSRESPCQRCHLAGVVWCGWVGGGEEEDGVRV